MRRKNQKDLSQTTSHVSESEMSACKVQMKAARRCDLAVSLVLQGGT